MSLADVGVTAAWVFLIVVIVQPLFARIADAQDWVDKPGARKRHHHATPLAGGLAIVTGLLFSVFLSPWPSGALGLLIALFIVFSIGFWDDLNPLRARHRLIAQLTAVAAAIIIGGSLITSLDGTFTAWALPLGILSLPFTLVALTGVINAFNMSDGVDGLCGGYSAVALFWLVVVGYLIDQQYDGSRAIYEISGIAATGLAAVAGFLVYNMRYPGRRRAMVFLGDGGSLVLGLLVGWLIVRAAGSFGEASMSPVTAICLLLLPLADMFSSVIRRYRAGLTPLTADRRHIHHLLISRGLSARRAVFILNLIAFAAGGLGVMVWQLGGISHFVFWAVIGAFGLYCWYAHVYWRSYRRKKALPSHGTIVYGRRIQRT